MHKTNRDLPQDIGDFLDLFDGTAGANPPAAPPAPLQFPQPSPPIAWDPNDPRIAQAMAHAREQERLAHHRQLDEERQRRAQLEREVEESRKRKEEEEAARLAALKGDEKLSAEFKQMKKMLEQRDAQMAATVAEANNRITAWQTAARKNEILRHYQGRIDERALDTSNPQALEASVPAALESYQQQQQHFFQEFQRQMGLAQQNLVEGLAPYPQNAGQGYPTPVNAGSPAPAGAAPQGMPQFTHPQIDGGASYGAARAMAQGRVFDMAQPQIGAQPFLPGAPYQQAPAYPQYPVTAPQGLPTPQAYPPQHQYGAIPGYQAQPYPGMPNAAPMQPQMPQGMPQQPAQGGVPDVEWLRRMAAEEAAANRQNPQRVGQYLKGQAAHIPAFGGGAPGPVPAATALQGHPMHRNG